MPNFTYSGLVYRIGDTSAPTAKDGSQWRFSDADAITWADTVPVLDGHNGPEIGRASLEMRTDPGQVSLPLESTAETPGNYIWATVTLSPGYDLPRGKRALSMETSVRHGRIGLTDSGPDGLAEGTDLEITAIALVGQGAMPGAMLEYAEFSANNEKDDNEMTDTNTPTAPTGPTAPPKPPVTGSPSAERRALFSADEYSAMDDVRRSHAAGGWQSPAEALEARFAAVTNAAGKGLAFDGLIGANVVTLADVAAAAGAQMTVLGNGVAGLSVSALTPPASPSAAADGAAGTEVAGFAAAAVQSGRAWSWTDASFGRSLSASSEQLIGGHALTNAVQVDKVILAALDAVDVAATPDDLKAGILGAAAAAGVPTSRVVVTGPVDEIAAALAIAPASAQDIAGAFTTVHGAFLHVTNGAAAASGIRVFAAPALSIGLSPVAAQSAPEPSTGNTRFGSGLWVEAAMNLTTAVRLVGGAA